MLISPVIVASSVDAINNLVKQLALRLILISRRGFTRVPV
jgi:hypothetical protein